MHVHRYRGVVHHCCLRRHALCARFRDIDYAADAAQALKPLAGQYAYILFAVGLFNASLFAASILPLSTAYTVCEGLGFESGVDKKFGEAPFFYWLYTLLIVAGGILVLSDSRSAAGQDRSLVTGFERSCTAVCVDLHAAADQQERTDGRVCKLASV